MTSEQSSDGLLIRLADEECSIIADALSVYAASFPGRRDEILAVALHFAIMMGAQWPELEELEWPEEFVRPTLKR